MIFDHTQRDDPVAYSGRSIDRKWANKLLKGGYILYFRHAERSKWLDSAIYDTLESEAHNNGINGTRYAENEYFGDATCLNKRGKIQAKAMKEHLDIINLPIGFVISSPICRARQTANIVFGGYQELNRDLVLRGRYTEDLKVRTNKLKNLFNKFPIRDGSNTIVTAHGGGLVASMFEKPSFGKKIKLAVDLKEGGFLVISRKNGKLKVEHSFRVFSDFSRHFYERK
tara:strand:- start:491 stop:1171 length:681 start_codon:yes stop_codon:yes gene_type:complete